MEEETAAENNKRHGFYFQADSSENKIKIITFHCRPKARNKSKRIILAGTFNGALFWAEAKETDAKI